MKTMRRRKLLTVMFVMNLFIPAGAHRNTSKAIMRKMKNFATISTIQKNVHSKTLVVIFDMLNLINASTKRIVTTNSASIYTRRTLQLGDAMS